MRSSCKAFVFSFLDNNYGFLAVALAMLADHIMVSSHTRAAIAIAVPIHVSVYNDKLNVDICRIGGC